MLEERPFEPTANAGTAEHWRAEERALLAPYVTNLERPVFALKNLPEEVVAVLFAYYSRSRQSLRRNLLELLTAGDLALQGVGAPADLALARERARKFHEKWVIGYGHASVAEHAVVHLALEDVSIVASKVVEDMRLASFTEKSTRYVPFDPARYYPLCELRGTPAEEAYQATVQLLFATYRRLLPQVMRTVATLWPRRPNQSERAHEAACRAKALDVLRYLLPAGTLTNLGMTINGRALEHLLTKMFSHPLPEVQRLAAWMKEEASHIVPTLLKYAQKSPYLAETNAAMQGLADELMAPVPEAPAPAADSVQLVVAPPEAETQLVAAILYGYSRHAWHQVLARARALSPEEKARVIDEYLKRRGPHDQPLRALEQLTYTWELCIDFGAYRDIQRHRMATQIRQLPSPQHGYSLPEDLDLYGCRTEIEACLARAAEAYTQIATVAPELAIYVLPLAYRVRVLMTWNLREMYHFVQLRSAKQGHPAYRRVAQAIYRVLEATHPLLARYMRVDLSDYPLARL
ncbi:MAG: thymidylate synthase [Candidatus Tectimicrobiota bacterium]|nr:MAG: thymidylate synthase [Candidatus Tectomicrobia bacterium]